jgi:hypothetical protein
VAFRDARHGVVVGGDYTKEHDAVDNVAVTDDGGVTWTLVRTGGLGGFRSAVTYAAGAAPPALLAVGPSGADVSRDDGRSWQRFEGPGFHALAIAPGSATGWAVGESGRIARLDLGSWRGGLPYDGAEASTSIQVAPGAGRPAPADVYGLRAQP